MSNILPSKKSPGEFAAHHVHVARTNTYKYAGHRKACAAFIAPSSAFSHALTQQSLAVTGNSLPNPNCNNYSFYSFLQLTGVLLSLSSMQKMRASPQRLGGAGERESGWTVESVCAAVCLFWKRFVPPLNHHKWWWACCV